jgi:2'-5' RNA ligase
MKRLFIAVKITPDQNFLKVYGDLKSSLFQENIKWVQPSNFHLTLKFLGDTYEDDIPIVTNVINDVLASESSFNFDLRNIGVFGSRYDPRVIWFGIEESGYLRRIGMNMINSLDEAGFKKDRQNFVPHLTIARIRNIENKKGFNEILELHRHNFIQTVKVDNVILYESILMKKGPQYKIINKFLLK